MAIGSFVSRVLAALIALGSAALAQTEAPHPYRGPSGNPPVLISPPVTVSSSASLQISGTNWSSSYNTLFLNCEGILSADGFYSVYVGEGGTPTWETAANYTNVVMEITAQAGGGTSTTSFSTSLAELVTAATSGTIPASLKLYIDNVASSSIIKAATYLAAGYYDSSGWRTKMGSSYWNNDTNAITGLELVPGTGGTISGTCSLYGMN
jgi:hypothetical protein